MGFFDRDVFDFNGDGKVDGFETFVGLQMMAGSRLEAIALTGDDTFYVQYFRFLFLRPGLGRAQKKDIL